MRRSILRVILALLVIGGVPGAVAQEPYPTRPITLVNPFPPGGLADLTGRPLAAALERVLKQPVVVSNKAGAAGAVGMQSVAIAKPDGYTLLISVPAITLLPEVDAIFGRPPTFSRDQFAGIARLNADPTILVVNADAPHLKSGKVRAFAVTSATRHPSFPDVPTLIELGYNVEYYLWTALFVPKNVPPTIQRLLRDATRQAVQDTEFRNAMEKIQTPIAYQDADEFNAWWAEDAKRLTAVVKKIGRVEEK